MRNMVQRGFKSCNASLTLQSVARGLPLNAMHELRQAVPALAPSHVAVSDTKSRDLTLFWQACERGLAGLGPALQPHLLRREHLEQLAPHLVGEHVRGHVWSPSIGHHFLRLQQCHCALHEPVTVC